MTILKPVQQARNRRPEALAEPIAMKLAAAIAANLRELGYAG